MKFTSYLIGISVMLASCSQQPPTPHNETTQTPDQAKSAQLEAAAVDPLTATSAGLSIASSLKNLFGKNSSERDLGKIKKQLTEIAQQNRQILKTLGEIVTILNNLGVTIRENVRLETVFNLEAAISGQADQLYETRLAELDDRRAGRQATVRYRNQILPRVRDLTHELMNEGYGYSAFDSVGHGMIMEMWMSRRLGERPGFRSQAGATYVGYFTRALDPEPSGTPAHALAKATAERDRAKAILDAADARIAAGFSTHRDYTKVEGIERDWTERTFRETTAATGNQRDGYSVKVTTAQIAQRSWTEPSDGRPGCIRCAELEASYKAAQSAPPPPPPPARPRPPAQQGEAPEAMVNLWNSVRTTYVQASRDAEALSKVVETLRLYLNEAQLAQAE